MSQTNDETTTTDAATTDATTTDPAVEASTQKPPQEWVTGDEPATGAQLSYLETLAREVGVDLPADLTKAHASELIDDLRNRSPRVDT
jgi:hypothetical protein